MTTSSFTKARQRLRRPGPAAWPGGHAQGRDRAGDLRRHPQERPDANRRWRDHRRRPGRVLGAAARAADWLLRRAAARVPGQAWPGCRHHDLARPQEPRGHGQGEIGGVSDDHAPRASEETRVTCAASPARAKTASAWSPQPAPIADEPPTSMSTPCPKPSPSPRTLRGGNDLGDSPAVGFGSNRRSSLVGGLERFTRMAKDADRETGRRYS